MVNLPNCAATPDVFSIPLVPSEPKDCCVCKRNFQRVETHLEIRACGSCMEMLRRGLDEKEEG